MGHEDQNVVHWRRDWNGKPVRSSCLENPMKTMKRQKDRTLKDELPRSVGVQYATGDQWRNNSRKNEETEPKQKRYPAVDVTGGGSKVRCCKEQYCIGQNDLVHFQGKPFNMFTIALIIDEAGKKISKPLNRKMFKWILVNVYYKILCSH